MRKALRRSSAPRGAQLARGVSLPAPVEGWDASSPIARMSDKRALVLDNWIPRAGWCEVRRGFQVHSHGMGSGEVESLLAYHGLTPAASKLFAAANNAIYDATSNAEATSAVTSLSNNRWQGVNFTTSGGKYLWICNGANAPRHYNGSAWATPSLTISGLSSDAIINVNAHKNRIWVVFKDSTVAGYLDVGAVAGTVTKFELGGVFTKGGHLVAMATWTRDGGSGPDDAAVFLSSQGQAAVYAGTDPSSAETWALVGVYDIAPPIGYRCMIKVGGDVAVITIAGVLPLSLALQSDQNTLPDIALTKRIRSAMNDAARDYKGNFGWELCPYPRGGYALLNVPIQEGVTQHQYVVNTETGAWCRFKGQNANCWAVFRDELYFGSNDGYVMKADQTAYDLTDGITAVGQGAYNYFNNSGSIKEFKLLQAIVTSDSEARPAVGVSTDFRDNATVGTPTAAQDAAAVFDEAVFDEAVFPVEDRTIADWASVSNEGYCASIHFRASTGQAGDVALWGLSDWGDAEWSGSISGDVTMRLNGFGVIYEQGQVL